MRRTSLTWRRTPKEQRIIYTQENKKQKLIETLENLQKSPIISPFYTQVIQEIRNRFVRSLGSSKTFVKGHQRKQKQRKNHNKVVRKVGYRGREEGRCSSAVHLGFKVRTNLSVKVMVELARTAQTSLETLDVVPNPVEIVRHGDVLVENTLEEPKDPVSRIVRQPGAALPLANPGRGP